jgi:monoamine oxidase
MSTKTTAANLNRRRFIQGTGVAALSAGLVAHGPNSAAASVRGKTGFDYDALVIGGGFAGVTAARDLKKNGYSCAILEARNRLGGRTYYAPHGDLKVELGGTWIHWMQPFVWAEVMRYGLEVKETPGATAERIIQLKDGKAFEPDLNQLYGDLFAGGEGLMQKSREVWPRPFDAGFNMEAILAIDGGSIMDLLEFMELTDAQMGIYLRLLGGGVNARVQDVSANEALRIIALSGHNIGSYYDVNARYQLKDGTIALIEKIVEDGKPDIRLNTYIKAVEQKADHVVVTTISGEQITAATLVCTAPLNVLKDIEFRPGIHPDKLAASREGHPGQGFKVYAEVKGRIPNVLLYGDNNEAIEEALAYHIADDKSLIACFGNDHRGQDIYDEKYLQATLRKYLPDIEVTGSAGYGWVNDPFAKGTWCTWRPNWYRKYGEGLRDGPEGRIYFASSDYCEGSRGYIDGAIGSGIKAAQQISDTLG